VSDVEPTPDTSRASARSVSPGARILILAAGVLVIVGLLWLIESNALLQMRAAQEARVGGGALRIGAPAPDFRLLRLDGAEARLSDYRGQRVLINFWATWCPPCRAEMRDLDQVAVTGRKSGVVVLGVDQLEDSDRVRTFVDGLGITGIVVLLDTDGRVSSTYRVNGLPSSFFVDEDGVLRDIAVGPLSVSTATARLERIRK